MLLSEEASFLQFFHLKFCNHFFSSSYRIRFCLLSCCNFKGKTDIVIIPRYVYLFWVQVYVFAFLLSGLGGKNCPLTRLFKSVHTMLSYLDVLTTAVWSSTCLCNAAVSWRCWGQRFVLCCFCETQTRRNGKCFKVNLCCAPHHQRKKRNVW